MTWWAGYGWGVLSGVAAVAVVLASRYHVIRRLTRSELDELAYGPIVRDGLHREADGYFDRREQPW